jgi:2-iminobutanoate/2-iminopropanoate deaminase
MATKTVGPFRTTKASTAATKKGVRTAKKPLKKAASAVKRTPAAMRQPSTVTKTIDPGWAWDDRLPLAQAKQIGNTIYVSGQVAYDATGTLIGEGDIKAQTRQVFENIKTVLAAAGAGLADIIKINTYITDQSKFMDMLAVRSEIFGANPPASTAVVVAGLAFPGLLIEVEAIAIKA